MANFDYPPFNQIHPPPQEIDFLELERQLLIGHGYGYEFHHVIHTPTAQPYILAVKYGFRERLEDFMLQNEIRFLCLMDHRNLVNCHGISFTEYEIQLLFEFYTDNLHGIRINKEHILSIIAKQILGGLRWLHSYGFAHRNISPYNFVIDLRGNLKLKGFGLSTELMWVLPKYSRMNVGWSLYKSHWYLSNHLYSDDVLGEDIWGFGISMMEIYLGGPPYDYDRVSEFKNNASWAFQDFVDCCLEYLPWKRSSEEC
ncbi:mitogen-activated protein kinase kinase 5-like [Pistacia vera]|uniref:mitogen-activated protein kinase kinase 5-like n=1 Tax=Pistacia vera TaxID=55513 RepID=UPI0012636994|nr:mitogen-activated protein kinase kinase 5-like [Pistacia vera]